MNKQKLKVYCGNFDGIREGLVVARNQKEAAGLAGCSLYHFREYWVAVDCDREFKPWQLYTRIPNYRPDSTQWVEGICAKSDK